MGTRTYGQVIERARRILQDTNNTNYRYSQQSLVDSTNDAMLEIRRIRPDLFTAVDFNPTDVTLGNEATTAIPIEDFCFQSAVYMVAGYQMLKDDEFSLDSRAVNLLNKGTAQLLTVAA